MLMISQTSKWVNTNQDEIMGSNDSQNSGTKKPPEGGFF